MTDKSTTLVGNWNRAHAANWPVAAGSIGLQGFLGERAARNVGVLRKALDAAMAKPFITLERGEALDLSFYGLAAETDVFKMLEGLCYICAQHPDAQLRSVLDEHVEAIRRCQHSDGYIGLPNKKRFDTDVFHDLYIAGHYVEMAVAHYHLTGSNTCIESACKWIDMLLAEKDRGNDYFDRVGHKEHPEIELALVRLFRATGEKKYLDFALWNIRQYQLGDRISRLKVGQGDRHVVRFAYLIAGCVEYCFETGDDSYINIIETLWDEVERSRMYLTGGVGVDEHFHYLPYVLPQQGAIAETCGYISMMMAALRLYALTGKSRYCDYIELALYNGLLGALSEDQDAIFYYNSHTLDPTDPADTWHNAGRGAFKRAKLPDYYPCNCCMPNAIRFLAQLPEYACAVERDHLAINLYAQMDVRFDASNGQEGTLRIRTSYPFEECVRIESTEDVNVKLRLPGWCRSPKVKLGGDEKAVGGDYYQTHLKRNDTLELWLPMVVNQLQSNPYVRDTLGQVAIVRGPIVYCYEQPFLSSPSRIGDILVQRVDHQVTWKKGLPLIGFAYGRQDNPGTLYRPPQQTPPPPFEGFLIPFYARANGPEETVWSVFLRRE